MIRFQTDYEPLTCSIDPISLTGLALGAAGATAASSLLGGSAPTPQAPPQQAPPPQAPIGNRQGQAATPQTSFIGSSAVPQSNFGQKTLLGQ